eukprot:GHVU01115492.1.p3 GENE.GHVU01115492.1~~GHVU01115492.1.p3  ORF type:complete len:105 (-),score=12.58 GHVU01115492.1:970-1284(-)
MALTAFYRVLTHGPRMVRDDQRLRNAILDATTLELKEIGNRLKVQSETSKRFCTAWAGSAATIKEIKTKYESRGPGFKFLMRPKFSEITQAAHELLSQSPAELT